MLVVNYLKKPTGWSDRLGVLSKVVARTLLCMWDFTLSHDYYVCSQDIGP